MKNNNELPIVGYELKIHNLDKSKTTVKVRAVSDNGFYTFSEKNGYLVDSIIFLEEIGVDRFEIQAAIENMEEKHHDVAYFGMMGSFIYSDFKGLKH